MTKRSDHRCIVCDKAITKRLRYMYFRDPVEAVTDGPSWHQRPERPDGHREGGAIPTLYLANRPSTKEEAQRYMNETVIRVKTDNNGLITEAAGWDGETYTNKFFCTNKCAMDQGYASAHHGHRFTWKKHQ